jgi:hypothetical protein
MFSAVALHSPIPRMRPGDSELGFLGISIWRISG